MTDNDRAQLTRADLDGMAPEEIAAAHDAGRLAVLLGMDPADAALITRAQSDPITLDDVRDLARLGRHDLVNDAHRDGRITGRND